MKETVGLMVAYNTWANKRIASMITLLDTETLDRQVVSSFPSIRKTVYHIWDAEFIWLNRLQGNSIADWPSKQFGNDVPLGDFTKISDGLLDLVRENGDEWLNQVCNYTNMKGNQYSTPYFQILLHLMNHSTFHRGQLVTMLRQVGVEEIKPTDLIVYLRNPI